MKKENIPQKKKPISEKITESKIIKWIGSSIGRLILESLTIVLSVFFAVCILFSTYAPEQEMLPQPAIEDKQLLSILESIKQSTAATADISEATYKSYDEFSKALEELMIMNTVFMEWAEQQGLITKVPYEQED